MDARTLSLKVSSKNYEIITFSRQIHFEFTTSSNKKYLHLLLDPTTYIGSSVQAFLGNLILLKNCMNGP